MYIQPGSVGKLLILAREDVQLFLRGANEDFDTEIARYMQYGDLTKQEATDELVADYAMKTLFADAKTAREVTQKHSKLAEAIRNALAWIREHIFHQTDAKVVDRAAKIWNDAYNEARRNKSLANSAEAGYNGVKNSKAQNNDKLIRYFTGSVREGDGVYLSNRDKAVIASSIKSGNGWMYRDGKRGYVYTDTCFYTFDFNADRSVTVTDELLIEDDADIIRKIRKGETADGYTESDRRYDNARESQGLRQSGRREYYVSSGDGNTVSQDTGVYGQESRSGRGRADGRGLQTAKAVSETAAQEETRINKKADSSESAFSVGEAERAKLSEEGVDIVGGSAVKNSLASWNETDKTALEKSLEKAGFASEDARKWIQDVDSVAAVILSSRDRLDYAADRTKTFLKNNAEYIKTLDASTLCAKRVLYQGTFDAVQRAMPNKALLPRTSGSCKKQGRAKKSRAVRLGTFSIG